MFLLTLRDIQFRALRFTIAIIGTALVFAMVLIMAGLAAQFRKEPQDTVEAFGAGSWVIKEGVTGAFTSGATIDAAIATKLRNAGADETGPLISVRHTATVDGSPRDILLVGHSLGGLGEPTRLVEGVEATGRGEAVASKESKLALNAETTIGGKKFKVVGLTDRMTLFGGTPLVFVDIRDAQELVFQGRQVATAIVVKESSPTIPSDVSGVQLTTTEDTWRDALRPLEKPVGAIDVVGYLLWVIAATIIGAVVYLSALERLRDFAVMKAVGASSKGLLIGLATQSVLVAMLAAFIASGITFGLVPLFPIPISVPVSAFVQLPILALFAGLLASLGGLRKAVKVDPALAFSGPGG